MRTADTIVVEMERAAANRGWVFYDGECPLCIGAVARFAPVLRRHHFDFASLQAPWVRQKLGLKPGEPLTEMKLLVADGWIYGGAEALTQIVRHIWWAWPLFVLAQIPVAKFLLRATYQKVAANRNCLNGMCALPKSLPRRHTTRTFLEMP